MADKDPAMTIVPRILLVEDSPRDAELALDALAANHLANEVVHVRDGAVFRSYELDVNAYVVKPVKFGEFVDAVKQVGAFWTVVNEPPPGSVPRRTPPAFLTRQRPMEEQP